MYIPIAQNQTTSLSSREHNFCTQQYHPEQSEESLQHQPTDYRRICNDDRAECGSFCAVAYYSGVLADDVPFEKSVVPLAGQPLFPCAAASFVDHEYFPRIIKTPQVNPEGIK